MPRIYSATGAEYEKWSRASVPPRVSPRPRRGGSAVSLARGLKAKVMGCVGNAPTLVREGHPLYRRLALFTRLPTLEWWTATALHRALPLARRATSWND